MLGCRLRSCSDDRGRCEMRLTGAICDLGNNSVFADPNKIPNKFNHATHIKYRISNIKQHIFVRVCVCVTLLLQKA